ncbi:MAG: M48 family metallopeptidase [Turicibacter sp.]
MKRNEVLNVGGFEIQIERKKIKNIYLKVKRNGDIVLSAPTRIEMTYLEQFIQSKLSWIQQKKKNYEQREQKGAIPTEKNDSSVYLFGEKLIKLPIKATAHHISVESPYLKLYYPPQTSEEIQEAKLEKWLLEQLDKQIKHDLMTYWHYFKAQGISPVEIKYRKMKATWGVCRPTRRSLTFNKNLVHCHPNFIEYVVVHELCHLIHPNHGQQFYELVQQLLPQWKTYAKRYK